MHHGPAFFYELLALFAVSACAIILFRRLKLPVMLAYVLTGVVLGTHGFHLIKSEGLLRFCAEFGVVFLLFTIGLEFSLSKLMELRRYVLGLGGTQVAVCTLLFAAALITWGTGWVAGIILACAMALSSTAVVIKELAELDRVHLQHSRMAIGVLLFQDLAAVLVLIAIPLLTLSGDALSLSSLGLGGLNLAILVAAIYAAAKWLPRLYDEIASHQLNELFVLATLIVVLLSAVLTEHLGLSLALGAFIAGSLLAETPYHHEIEASIRPFKHVLLGLFFVSIGVLLDPKLIADHWFRILVFTAALLTFKTLLIALLCRLFGQTASTALQTGLILSQAGEFGFVLIALGTGSGLIPADIASFMLTVAVISMAVTPSIVLHSDSIARVLLSRVGLGMDTALNAKAQQAKPEVIVFGYGRVGQTVTAEFKRLGHDCLVVDLNPEHVKLARERGIPALYANVNDPDILGLINLEQARIGIITFPNSHAADRTVQRLKSDKPALRMFVRNRIAEDVHCVEGWGVDQVVTDATESALTLLHHGLLGMEYRPAEVSENLAAARARW